MTSQHVLSPPLTSLRRISQQPAVHLDKKKKKKKNVTQLTGQRVHARSMTCRHVLSPLPDAGQLHRGRIMTRRFREGGAGLGGRDNHTRLNVMICPV